MNTGWIKGLIYSFLLTLPGVTDAQQAPAQILVVKSSDNSYFDQTIETLRRLVGEPGDFTVIAADELGAGFAPAPGTRLIVTLGENAVRAVKRLDSPPPSLNAYLTREQYLGLGIEQQVTVLLDQPLQRYLAFCKFMLGADRIGVIAQGRIELEPEQQQLLHQLELELAQYRINAQNKLLPVLRRLLRQNDTLLMLPRRAIYNRDSLKGVLLTSYRSRKPVISYSPAHVKSGALASIYSSPVDIGRHLAQLARQLLEDPSAGGPAFHFARFYSISSNRQVARSLGIDLPGETVIRRQLDALEK